MKRTIIERLRKIEYIPIVSELLRYLRSPIIKESLRR